MTVLLPNLIIGAICIIIGISNMRGNISSLHSYHRSRVAPEDVKPFGKLVGIGMIIIGIGLIISGGLLYATVLTDIKAYTTAGMAVMVLGFVAGLAISFFAMIKYNKGIF